MANKVILKAESLDGYLTESDRTFIEKVNAVYSKSEESYKIISSSSDRTIIESEKQKVIKNHEEITGMIQNLCRELKRIKIYSFETEKSAHAEASRVIAKLRDIKTNHNEFMYYIQRAYEMLFKLAFVAPENENKSHLFVKTPVNMPVQQYSVHQVPDVNAKIANSVMCVMLRGALLPSMIMSKEITDYSKDGYITPFALFKIKRDDTKHESDMEYIIDLDNSFFDFKQLDGKDLIFADPMNATGGSLVTVVKYLEKNGVKPKSISFFNVISALKGSIRVVRALENCTVYTLWMDPVLNESAYILPGLGDAGDRLNGCDTSDTPRNIIQLIADYGSHITDLYRTQIREIEHIVLGRH